jgi:hypothetical protein
MVKITYHISGAADIQPTAIFDRILSLLDRPGYVLLEKTSKTITFKYNIWRIGSRTKVLGKVDGGRIEINSEGKGVLVNFDYYVSLDFWILFLVFFVFFAITKGIHILYFIPVICIFFYFKVENVKGTAKGWMKEILLVA